MPPIATTSLSPRLTLLLAATAALAVGTIYLPQALVPLIVEDLRVPAGTAALAITAAQVGYAVGIALVAPLGDRIAHRTLVLAATAAAATGLAAAAFAPGAAVLVAANAAVGVAAVSAQVVGPLAAALADPQRRGAVVGTLLSGSIAGMLLARAGAGLIGGWLGWRAAYAVAAVLALALLAVLVRSLPPTRPESGGEPYARLIAAPLGLLRAEPALRRSCVAQAGAFAGFSAVWGSVALLLTGPAFRLGPQAVGLLALVGALTSLCTPFAGRLVDRRGPDAVTAVCLLGVVAAAAVLALAAGGGGAGLAALLAGMLLLDVAMQCGMVANVARVYAIGGAARSRMTTAYMLCAYSAGSAGSVLGAALYGAVGWLGVCVLAAAPAAAALAWTTRAANVQPGSPVRG